MKVQQEILPYRPVTIKLEKKWEAVALFGLIDIIEKYRHIDGFFLNADEHKMIKELLSIKESIHI